MTENETPNQIVKAVRGQRDINAEHKRNAAFRQRFHDIVSMREAGQISARAAVERITAVGQDMAPFVWGQDHLLWNEYTNAIRLCWVAPGAGYTNRAITSRKLTAEASRSHVPSFENEYDYSS